MSLDLLDERHHEQRGDLGHDQRRRVGEPAQRPEKQDHVVQVRKTLEIKIKIIIPAVKLLPANLVRYGNVPVDKNLGVANCLR